MTIKDQHQGNRVLQEDFRTSKNFYQSDRILQDYLALELSKPSRKYMSSKLERLGAQAATEMDELSLLADKRAPELVKRDRYGELIDEIRFHPAYDRLMEIAVQSEMMRVKWEPDLRRQFGYERNRLGFAAGYLYAMAESGQYCPLCMTDGVALLLDRLCRGGRPRPPNPAYLL